MCERELETEQNCIILTPTLVAISVSFLFSRVAQPGAWWGFSVVCWFSLPHLVTNWSGLQTDLISNCSCSIGAWGLLLLGAGFLYRILSPTGLVSKLTDFPSSPSYMIVQRPPSCGRHNFALIQPVPGQGYNILIDRMHLLFTYVHFLFWQPGRIIGQHTTDLDYNIFLICICAFLITTFSRSYIHDRKGIPIHRSKIRSCSS